MAVNRLITVGQIAQQTGLPIHRVEYLIASRKIKPIARAGHLRIFDERAVEQIRQAAGFDRRKLETASLATA